MAILLIAITVAIPIWTVDYPGMVDYPNHLARCYILAHYHASPFWQARYLVVYDPLPNLAMDLIVVPLNHFLPILVSGKIFLTLAALLYVLGCVWLGSAIIGKWNWFVPFASLTFYNSALLYGFVNYVFGVAVFLCAFAFWMQSRARMPSVRFVLCCVLSLVAYLSHLSAFIFLGVACTTVASMEWRRHRDTLLLVHQLAWLVCPVLLMAGFLRRAGKGGGGIDWSTISEKAIYLFAPIRGYNLAFDAATIAIVLICAVVILMPPKIHSVAAAGAVMFCLFLVTPKELFTVSGADARYVIPAFLLVILSIEPKWGQAQKAALIVATVAMVVRTADITANWVDIDRRERRVLQMGDILPTNASVFLVDTRQQPILSKYDRVLPNVINLWAVSRQVSVSGLFSRAGQQPLVARQPPCADLRSQVCLASYNYIWTDNPLPVTEQLVRSVADPAAVWESVTLWKIRR